MAKWYGKIGYAVNVESESAGVWTPEITERTYYGELERNNRRLQTNNSINESINISNVISILADPYAVQNFYAIRYVEFMGAKWRVSDVEVQYPRLRLTLGGLYNGE